MIEWRAARRRERIDKAAWRNMGGVKRLLGVKCAACFNAPARPSIMLAALHARRDLFTLRVCLRRISAPRRFHRVRLLPDAAWSGYVKIAPKRYLFAFHIVRGATSRFRSSNARYGRGENAWLLHLRRKNRGISGASPSRRLYRQSWRGGRHARVRRCACVIGHGRKRSESIEMAAMKA